MRLLASFLLFLFIQLAGHAQEIMLRGYPDFLPDSTYYVLADQVNVREQPSVDAPVIGTLRIASRVTVIDKADEEYSRNGWDMNWFKISFDDGKQQGYIWGGFLATGSISSATEKGLLFLYGPHSVKVKNDFSQVILQVRAVRQQTEVARTEFRCIGSLGTYSGIRTIGNKKVDGVKEVLEISFSDSECGGAFGDAVVFWDGTQLYMVKLLTDGADGGYFSDESFTYPSDKGGKPGIIIFKYKQGYYSETEGKDIIEASRRIIYSWNGTELVKQP